MKRDAFGAIDLLLGLLIIGVIAVLSMNTFNNTTSTLNKSNSPKNVRQYVDEQVNEIEKMKQESIKLQEEIRNQNY